MRTRAYIGLSLLFALGAESGFSMSCPDALEPFLGILGRKRIHAAVLANSVLEIDSELAQGESIDTVDNLNQTALFLAAQGGRLDLVLELLKRGASKDIKSHYRKSAADEAERLGFSSIVEALK